MYIILVYNALSGFRIVRRKHLLNHSNQTELNSYEETGQERYQESRHFNHLYDVTIADVGQRAERLLALIKDKWVKNNSLRKLVLDRFAENDVLALFISELEYKVSSFGLTMKLILFK